MGNITYTFESLDVWQRARHLAVKIYQLLDQYPQIERYAICDQLRRACISVPSNIAEGSSRTSPKEQAHFIEIAYGSLMELLCQLTISVDLGYITQGELANLKSEIDIIAKMLTNLRAYFLNKTHKHQPLEQLSN
ncbi:MAG: four helix bundle protein [Bacteroidales bacterium]|nr:four helix bundle protein [Bacteroidales bacterium]